MYNGVGAPTARGSGSNGYVQSNKFTARPRSAAAGKPSVATGERRPSKEIMEHERQRRVELRLVLLRETLEEQGYCEKEIEERLDEVRKGLEEEAEKEREREGFGGEVPIKNLERERISNI